ncbi:MAG TPA: NUDIX domain-containing protein [Jatrophihabitans sp.]|nr:NUDIX domain-containing protein [Jatrophihabitans sp.]
MSRRYPCAGAIVHDGAGRLLLIQRGQPPSAGAWSVPGGRCLPAEEPAAACVREVAEETGLHVNMQRFAGRVERTAPDGGIYVIDDFVCQVVDGTLAAADDARDARWVSRADMQQLTLAPGLEMALAEWGLLPR